MAITLEDLINYFELQLSDYSYDRDVVESTLSALRELQKARRDIAALTRRS